MEKAFILQCEYKQYQLQILCQCKVVKKKRVKCSPQQYEFGNEDEVGDELHVCVPFTDANHGWRREK